MKIGIMVGEGSGAAPDIAALVERGKAAEAAGLDSAWIANIAIDAMTASAALGAVTDRIEIGTAVVPTFTRHPAAMAQQAACTQQICDGRFTLGIGLAHKFLVEGAWGLSYDAPARTMRDYLEVLAPQLRGEGVKVENERFRVQLEAPASKKPTSILVAALGPMMLELTGAVADGTITWATGIRTLADHIVPGITASANAAGRPAPRVVVGVPVLLTNRVDEARAMAAQIFAVYARIPSYRAMLDREGASGVEDLAIIGDEATVRSEIERIEQTGATDLCAFPFEVEDGEADRTVELLGSLTR